MDFLTAAQSEIGYTENPPGSNRTKFAAEAGHMNGQPWCATFIAAIANRTGTQLASSNPYTPTMESGFKKVSMYGYEPQVGAIAFFDFPDTKHRTQHVGIVESWDATTVTCIEGNTSSGPSGSQDNGGGVFRRRRPRSHVVGFGYVKTTPSPVVWADEEEEEMRLYQAPNDPTVWVTDGSRMFPCVNEEERDKFLGPIKGSGVFGISKDQLDAMKRAYGVKV